MISAGDAVFRVSQVLRLRHRSAVTGKEGDLVMLMPCSKDDQAKFVRSATVLDTTEIISWEVLLFQRPLQNPRNPYLSKFL